MASSRKTPTSRRSSSASTTAKLAQLGVAVPQVMAHRLTRMALAGPVLSARDRKEFTGMVMEKQMAFSQAWVAMTFEMLRLQQIWAMSLMTGQMPPIASAADKIAAKGLAPLHRKAAGADSVALKADRRGTAAPRRLMGVSQMSGALHPLTQNAPNESGRTVRWSMLCKASMIL